MKVRLREAILGGLLGAVVGIVLGLCACCAGFFLMEVYESTDRLSTGVVWGAILFVMSCSVGAWIGHRRAQMKSQGRLETASRDT